MNEIPHKNVGMIHQLRVFRLIYPTKMTQDEHDFFKKFLFREIDKMERSVCSDKEVDEVDFESTPAAAAMKEGAK